MTSEEFLALRAQAEAGDGEAMRQMLDELERILAEKQREFDALVARMKAGDEDARQQLTLLFLSGAAANLDTSACKFVTRWKIEKFDGEYSPEKTPVEVIEGESD